MDLAGFEMFLTYSIGLCAVLALVSPAIGWRRRGRQTLFLSTGFLAMAGVLYGLREGWPTPGIVALAVVLVILLGLDALTRSAKSAE